MESMMVDRASQNRRRPNAPASRQIVHKVKVNEEEEAALVARSTEQGVTVARLLVESALSPEPGETATDRRNALEMFFRIERLISNIASNVNQIARVANTTGSTDLSSLREHLQQAKAAYESIDRCVERFSL